LIVYTFNVRESYGGFVGGVEKMRPGFDARMRPGAGAGGRVCETQATTKHKLQRPRIFSDSTLFLSSYIIYFFCLKRV